MKIGILGGGFTGMAAALELLKKGHDVTIIEKNDSLGGLAIGFKDQKWEWSLERAYHHWFTNDDAILNLAKKINHKILIRRPITKIFIGNRDYQLDSLISLFKFPLLSFVEKIRFLLSLAFLKLLPYTDRFNKISASYWIEKYMGKKIYALCWEPLLKGKFDKFYKEISQTWFWARIKKRTSSLAYPEGGFQSFSESLEKEILKKGGKIFLKTETTKLTSSDSFGEVETLDKKFKFDRVLVTLPSPVFTKITPQLSSFYKERINSILHLHAQVMIFVLDKQFMDSYWLNVTDKDWPFLVLVEHTNFMDKKHYSNKHILYIGNYLPVDHPFLNKDKRELIKLFDPFLKKINKDYKSFLVDSFLFVGPFAQPIVDSQYLKKIPDIKTPLKNIFLANLDMTFPWDRGTNYAVELGQKAVKEIEGEDN